MKRVLIVRLSALGDIVHALPVLNRLRDTFPEAQIDWLVEENYAPALALAAGLTRRIIVRAKSDGTSGDPVMFAAGLGYVRAAKFLRSQRYDAALDLQGLLKSAVWARASGAQRVIGFDRDHLREPLAASFYTDSVMPDVSGHVIRKNLSILHAVNVEPGPPELTVVPHATPEMIKTIQIAGGSDGYIVINPGAAWPNKCWPPERFAALALALRDRTGLHSLVTWGPKERALAGEVSRASGGAAAPAPATSVSDLAALMRSAALVIAGDTGPLHIGAAVGTPIVGLFGPTRPDARLFLAAVCRRIAVVGALLGAIFAVAGLTGCRPEAGVSVPDAPPGAAVVPNAVVERVVDGDTLDMRISGATHTVRLIGIDTPETIDPRRPIGCYGPEASARTVELLPPGTAVQLQLDAEPRDHFGRLLVYAVRSSDGLLVNLDLARSGHAEALSIEPNTVHAGAIANAVGEARAAGRGLWGACRDP